MTAYQQLDVSAYDLSAIEGLEPLADALGKDSAGFRPVLASDVDKLPKLRFAWSDLLC